MDNVKIDFTDGMVYFSLALLLIAFYGEPDLIDSLIKYFSNACIK